MLLKIHVEGETERLFADRILKPHLEPWGYRVLAIPNRTSPRHYGGLSTYEQFKNNTLRLGRYGDAVVTTMIDLYHLPVDFPGAGRAARIVSPEKKVRYLEHRLAEDLNDRIPVFVPYIQLHEFEALLFSRPDVLDRYLSMTRDSRFRELNELLDRYHHEPEHIDSQKGPSVYLRELYPGYRKATEGMYIAEATGLEAIRAACPHFNSWLLRLEELSPAHAAQQFPSAPPEAR